MNALLNFVVLFVCSNSFYTSALHESQLDNLRIRLYPRNLDKFCPNRKSMYECGKFIPQNNLISKVQIYKHNVIVAIPRYKSGIPITLGSFHLSSLMIPNIKPLPDWSYQYEYDCEAIQSAVDIFLAGDVLWVLDDGAICTVEKPYRKCPPKVLAISMLKNKVIHVIDLSKHLPEEYNLQCLVADVDDDDKENVNLYISDAHMGAILQITVSKNVGKILSLSSDIMENLPEIKVPKMWLSTKADNKKYLYFTFVDAPMIFSIETSVLASNESQILVSNISKPKELSFCGCDLENIYFTKRNETKILKLDINSPLNEENMQSLPTLKVLQVANVCLGPWNTAWVLESEIMNYVTDQVSPDGPNSLLYVLPKYQKEMDIMERT